MEQDQWEGDQEAGEVWVIVLPELDLRCRWEAVYIMALAGAGIPAAADEGRPGAAVAVVLGVEWVTASVRERTIHR